MPASLPAALLTALRRTARTLDDADVTWVVAGSSARALAGFAVAPHDLDIEVPTAALDAAAAALGLDAEDAHDERARSRRAVGTMGAVPIDVCAGLVLMGPGGVLPPDFDLMASFATTMDVGGQSVMVMPIEEQIVRILVTGDEERRRRFVAEAPDDFVPRDDYVSARLGSARATR